MVDRFLSFLNEIGFSEIQIAIYKYLLFHKFGTINDIKTELNYSYTQVYNNLMYLQKENLIKSSEESKPKLYVAINPKIALTELINKKFNNFKKDIKNLDEELKIQVSKSGKCIKDVTFYHYSDVNLALNNFFDLFERTQKEIVLTSLPPSLLKKIETSLYDAFMRGVQIKIFFSLSDFETYLNYFDDISNIFKRFRIEIIQTKQKTCQIIRYNDDIVNMGHILLDENYLNAIIFKEDEIFHFNGFAGPFAKQAKGYLEVLEVIKKVEIAYPEQFQSVLDIIEEYNSLKTRDLSRKSRIGGAKLREILQFLISEGVIEETLNKDKKPGRPKRVYSLIE